MSMIKSILGGFGIFWMIFGCLCIGGYIDTHYIRDGIIIDRANNILVIEDKGGDIWEWEVDNNSDDMKIGDKVAMSMYNNCTDRDITDDEILDLKKEGE